MAGTTPILGFPYPTGTDRVADGDNAIAALALAVENALPQPVPYRFASGGPITMGALNGNTGTTLTVTFPVGRFTAAPVPSLLHASAGYAIPAMGAVSATSFTARAFNPGGTSLAGVSGWWSAMQLTPAGPGRSEDEVLVTGTPYTVVCRTPGCENADEPIVVVWDHELDGPEVRAACGVCGQPITDTAATE